MRRLWWAVTSLCVGTSAAADPLSDGYAWLLSKQDTSGGFGSLTAEEATVATSDALAALALLPGAPQTALDDGQLFLGLLPPAREGELTHRRAVALKGSAFSFGAPTVQSFADGFDAVDPWSLAWTLFTSRQLETSTGADLTALPRRALDFALPSGCFAVADNDVSIELTSLLTRALKPFTGDPAVSFGRDHALNCLAAQQQPGGSFGDVTPTASAVLALNEGPAAFAVNVASARAWLMAAQRPDGSWGGVRATALALQALGAAPDWMMPTQPLAGRALFGLSSNQLNQGQPLTATIEIRNASNSAAPAAPLRVRAIPRAGGTAMVLGNFTVPPLAARGSTTLTVSLPTDGLVGRYQLEAEVDPLRLLPELDRTNNVALAFVNVLVGQDLLLVQGSISFSQPSPSTVAITVHVQNLGTTLPRAVPLEVHKGSLTGPLLGALTVPQGLLYAHEFVGTVTVSSSTLSGFTAIWAAVDPANVLSELNEDNNTSVRFYENGAERPVDLQIFAADFTVQGTAIAERQLTLSGLVRNLSGNDASRVQIAAIDGFGHTVAATEVALVPAGGSAPVGLSMTLSSTQTLRIEADPFFKLNDTARTNNFAAVQVNVTAGTNLVVQALNPSNPSAQGGVPVTLTASIRNDSPRLVSTLMRLTDETSGLEVTATPVQLGAGEVRQVVWNPVLTPEGPGVYRACIDPFDKLSETNENDNCATTSTSAATTAVTLESKDLDISPVGVDVGQPFTASATVHNTSNVAAQAVIEWWQGAPGFSYGKRVAEERISIPARSNFVARRDFIRDEGTPEIHARLSRFTPRNQPSPALVVQGGRHLFLEAAIALDVPEPVGPNVMAIRSGRLRGRQAPELVLGLRRVVGGAEAFSTIATFERSGASYAPLWTADLVGEPGDVMLVDLEGDGQGEVVVLTQGHLVGPASYETRMYALDSSGATKWSAQVGTAGVPGDHFTGMSPLDYDHDGVTDFAAGTSAKVFRVLSGRDGHPLLDVNQGVPLSGTGDVRITALDLTGDGTFEFLGLTEGIVGAVLFSQQGQLLWSSTRSFVASGAIADLSGTGSAQYLFPAAVTGTDLIDIATNQVLASAPASQAFNGNFNLITTFNQTPVGPLGQDGLSYAVYTPHLQGQVRAWRGDFDLRWSSAMRDTTLNTGDDEWAGTLADVYGLGRPQVIANSCQQVLTVLDGRNGNVLVPYPDSNDPCSSPGINSGNQIQQPPVVVDATGTGQTRVIVGYMPRGSPLTATGGGPFYGRAQALIFRGQSWKAKMPTAWATRNVIKGQLDENLRLASGSNSLRWWTTHNTWNDQFDVEPAKLLPDLALTVPSQGPATANQTFTLTATLKNVGGLTASDIPVTFYDGDTAIGSTTVAGPLAVRTGTAPVSLAWNPWPEGLHTVCVEANVSSAVEESGHDNNRACTTVAVRAATQSCDFEIAAPTVNPQPGIAGQPLVLSTTVRNIGALACPTAVVQFDEGPSSNVSQTVRVPMAALAAGATTTVNAVLLAYSGAQHFSLVVDPDGTARDSNLQNNITALDTSTDDTSVPDLIVTGVVVTPSPAYPGEAVTVAATIQNRGGSAPRASATIAVGDSPQVLELPALLPGETAVLSAVFTAPTATTAGQAVADSAGAVNELDEGNNTRAFALEVTDPLLTLGLTASPSSAGPDAAVGLAVTLLNGRASARELALNLEVLDATGAVTEIISQGARVVTGPGSAGFSSTWNTARRTPGSYSLRATAFESGRFVARASTTFEVLAEQASSAAVAVDKGTYSPRETVLLRGRAVNSSRNQSLLGATVTTTFFDAAGVRLQSSTRLVPSLPPLGVFELTDAHVLSPMAAEGVWHAEVELRDASGVLLASAVAPYQVQVVPNRSVVSRTTVQPMFPIGPALPTHVELTNTSSVALNNGVLSVELFDISGPQLNAAQSSASRSVSVPAGATTGFDFALATAGVNPGTKLLVTRLDGNILERLRIEAITVVDHEPPVITITGVFDGEFRRLDATPVITVVDASGFSSTITLDGAPFVSGTLVSAQASHLLQVAATDIFGNSAFAQLRFTIDKTPPVLTLGGVAPGAFVASAVTLTFSATDASPTTVSATVDGASFASGGAVTAEGQHIWTVSAVDAAGNTTTETRTFQLDFTAPLIAITGIADGDLRNTPAAVTFSATDASPTAVTATLDGAPFASGATASAEGDHVLQVRAVDAAGNTATATVHLTLDFTPPAVTVNGASDGQLARGPLTLTFSATDAHPGTTSATLDGAPFATGGTVGLEAAHTLVVSSTDAAGNSASKTVRFTLDSTAPVISITGVAEGQLSRTPVVVGFSSSDAHPGTTVGTLDGATVTSEITVSNDGAHTLTVVATDFDGNSSSTTVHFIIDKTPPTITVNGVTEGQTGTSFTPVVTVTDASAFTLSLQLDGANFVSGTTVTSAGAHTLTATATDAAGNIATRTVHFIVVPVGAAEPTFGFGVCAVNTMVIQNSAQVNGSVASNGSMQLLNAALVMGNAATKTDLTLRNSARITGVARYGGTLTVTNSATVQGGAARVTPAPSPCSCSYDVVAEVNRAKTSNDNALLTGNPSIAPYLSGGALAVRNATITLPGGTFYLTSLKVQGTARLKVAVGQRARLFVSGDVVVENSTVVGGPASQSGAVLIVSSADGVTGHVTLENASELVLRLYAPKADVALQNVSGLTGAVMGRSITVQNATRLTFDGPSDGGVPLVCP
ncbi:MAG: hypothetical protein IPJ65_28140 [Archangiaceae bacterium]|nr:hypothetical protein [Archangiaceae bacterium]